MHVISEMVSEGHRANRAVHSLLKMRSRATPVFFSYVHSRRMKFIVLLIVAIACIFVFFAARSNLDSLQPYPPKRIVEDLNPTGELVEPVVAMEETPEEVIGEYVEGVLTLDLCHEYTTPLS